MAKFPAHMTWYEFFALPDLLEYDLMLQQPFELYRGPLQAIKTPDDDVILVAEWLAHFMPPQNTWLKWKDEGHEELEVRLPKAVYFPLNLGLCIQLRRDEACGVYAVPPQSSKLNLEDVIIPAQPLNED